MNRSARTSRTFNLPPYAGTIPMSVTALYLSALILPGSPKSGHLIILDVSTSGCVQTFILCLTLPDTAIAARLSDVLKGLCSN